MLHKLLNQLSNTQQGLIALLLGFVLFFGALGKLGFLQDFLNIILVIVGIYLLLWGCSATQLWKKIANLKK